MVSKHRSNTNQTVQSQKQARSLKFGIKEKEEGTIRVTKTKALISFAVTAKLICIFVFIYADCCFSHEAAQMQGKYSHAHLMLLILFYLLQICSFFQKREEKGWYVLIL